MKAYFKKIAALTAAALLVLSMAACGGNDEEPTDTNVDNSNAVVDVPTEDAGTTEAGSEVSDTAASDETSEKADDTSDTKAASDTLSKEEAVALFNKATAAAKSMSGKRYTDVKLIEIPGEAILKPAIQVILPDPNKPDAVTGTPNEALNASDFSSVDVKKSGNNWVLTMNVKSETAPNHGANSRAFAELPQADIDKALGSLKVTPADSVKFEYSGGQIVATVSADGKLVNATYTMKVDVTVKNAKAVGVVKINSAKVSVTQTDKFGA